MLSESETDKLKEKIRTLEAEVADNSRLRGALKESEERYERVLENLKDEFLFYSHDSNGNFTYISPSYLNILGYTHEEYYGLNSADLWTDNPMNVEAERCTRLSCQGIRQAPYEFEIYHKDGSKRRFVTIELPIFNDKGELVAVEGTSRDITEKRKTEEQLEKYRLMLEDLVQQRTEELQTSQKQLADIIDFFPDPLYVVDTDNDIIAWNRAMVAMTGVTKGQVFGKNYTKHLERFYNSAEPMLIQMVLDGFFQADPGTLIGEDTILDNIKVNSKRSNLFREQLVPKLDQESDGYVWITAAPILDADQKVAGAVESIRDVTKIKQAERKIRQNERRLSALMSNLPGMAYQINISKDNWIVAFVSEGCQQIFGYGAEFFIDRDLTELRDMIHQDDLAELVEKTRAAVSTHSPLECEYRIIMANGESKWVANKAQILRHGPDNSVAIEGILNDFSVFKKMEQRLRNENFLLRSTIRDRYKFQNIIGNCPAMQNVFDLIVRAASSDDNVFIYGESGTGKELVAQAIHDTSDRKGKAFVAVNCSAIPESLIESEFFGSSKGAFTGALKDRPGYLTMADGGTLFLDEIGDISSQLQVKLLRAIDDGGFSPVGSNRVIRPNLRIIAASNKDLEEMMHSGHIRQDFFFRIHVIPIHLPPLRERDDDVYILVNHYLKKFSPSDSLTSLDREELEMLKNYSWPGNVRELQNVLRRFIALKHFDFMKLPPQPSAQKRVKVNHDTSTSHASLKDALIGFEKSVILKTLEQSKWNKTQTAKELGISRKTLFRKMKICGL